MYLNKKQKTLMDRIIIFWVKAHNKVVDLFYNLGIKVSLKYKETMWDDDGLTLM